MGNTLSFFNSSKVIFTGLQSNPSKVTVDKEVTLFYSVNDFVTNLSVKSVGTPKIAIKPPRGELVVLPTVVSVETDNIFSKSFLVTVDEVVDSSSVALSSTEYLRAGDSISFIIDNTEVVKVVESVLNNTVIFTSAFTTNPTVGDEAVYIASVPKYDVVKFTFTVTAADLGSQQLQDGFLQVSIIDSLDQPQEILVPINKV